MRSRRQLVLAAVVAAMASSAANAQTYPEGLYAEIATSKGSIVLSLDLTRTPMTVANFVGLAEGTIENDAFPRGRPFFDGSLFDRVVQGHVIQWGRVHAGKEDSVLAGYSIPNEIHPELSHDRAGVLGVGNFGPHTGSNTFYITLGDRSYLDGDYAVLGEVYSGLDVVMNIDLNDRLDSIRIVRVGAEAEGFRPTTESFREMVDVVWQSVWHTEAEKARWEREYVRSNWPEARTTADGWRYVVLEEGSGNAPAAGERVSLQYTGHTPWGLEFASDDDSCGPWYKLPETTEGDLCGHVVGSFATLEVASGVPRGLDAAVSRMRPGAQWIVIVPHEVGFPLPGYYPPARPGEPRFHISPNTLLIYEVSR